MLLNKGVYYIKYDNNLKNYYFQYVLDKFKLPDRIYGDTMSKCVRVWNHYALGKESTGCMFTGAAGSGKTKAGEILCNIAIDNGLPVIMCVEIKFNLELISFLSKLDRCVLFFDEFKKNVNHEYEQSMLTMLSDSNDTHKLFIITENDSGIISQYIRDRPGRVRYHFTYDKISKAVFEDYCNDFSNMDKTFYNDLKEKYSNSNIFSFDHLQSIIQEHLHYPDDSLDDILTTLNLHGLIKPRYFKIQSVFELPSNEPVMYNGFISSPREDLFKEDYRKSVVHILKEEDKNGDKFKYTYQTIQFEYDALSRIEDSNIYFLEVNDKEENEKKYRIEIILE